MSFPCTQCGQCCKNIKDIVQLADYHTGSGICVHYEDGIGCNIYNTRPDVCRIDEGYKNFFSDKIGLSDYYQKNAEVCNQLQEAAGVNKQYRVIL